MTSFSIFANGSFFGTFEADTEAAAIKACADEVGTEGDTSGMRAYEVTADQAAAVEAWWYDGADAGKFPLDA